MRESVSRLSLYAFYFSTKFTMLLFSRDLHITPHSARLIVLLCNLLESLLCMLSSILLYACRSMMLCTPHSSW